MLIAFFTIDDQFTTDGEVPWLEAVARGAWDTAHAALCSAPPYDTDGAMPYGHVYVGEFRTDGGLSSARQICEPWAPGEGILVGLVFEGTATGPMYRTHDSPVGVNAQDVQRAIPETFARHLDTAVRTQTSQRAHVWPEYHVSDWAYWERSTDLMTWSH